MRNKTCLDTKSKGAGTTNKALCHLGYGVYCVTCELEAVCPKPDKPALETEPKPERPVVA